MDSHCLTQTGELPVQTLPSSRIGLSIRIETPFGGISMVKTDCSRSKRPSCSWLAGTILFCRRN